MEGCVVAAGELPALVEGSGEERMAPGRRIARARAIIH